MQPPEKHVFTFHLVANFLKSGILMRFNLEKCQSVLFDNKILLNFVIYIFWIFLMRPEKTALFIDGSNFYAATRLLNMDVDYAKLHAHFSQNANLIRAYYYTALPEDQEFSPLRPLIDWLDYNGMMKFFFQY